MRATILVDTPRSWFHPWADRLAAALRARGHEVRRAADASEVGDGDVLYMLSCERVVPQAVLSRHRNNVVCHPSDLPRGRGWSPLAWQVLEGRNEIPVTLFEAVRAVDAGPIYFQEPIRLRGTELNDEIKAEQGRVTVELCLRFADAWPAVAGREQVGEPTYYPRRTADGSRLDPSKSLAEQFDLLRIVDNDRYPAFFEHRGRRYVLRIDAAPESPR